MSGRLLMRTGPAAPASFKLDRASVTIGREGDADITIASEEVSRRHAKIHFENGSYVVEDLKSLNGTYVNTLPVHREKLNHLDVITIGRTNDLIFLAHAGKGAAAVAKTDVLEAALMPVEGGSRIVLSRPSMLVGRTAPCDVVLENPAISKKHAMLERQGSRLVLTDLGSANGTFVNGERVTSRDVRAGDRLSFARSGEFIVQIFREGGQDEAEETPYRAAPPHATAGGATQAVWTVSEARDRMARMEAMATGAAAPPAEPAKPAPKAPAAPPAGKPKAASPPAAPPAVKETRVTSPDEVRQALEGKGAPPPTVKTPGAATAPTRITSPDEVKKALEGKQAPPPTIETPAAGTAPTRITSPDEVKKALEGKQAPPPTIETPAAGTAPTRITSPDEVKKALEGKHAPPPTIETPAAGTAPTRITSPDEVRQALEGRPQAPPASNPPQAPPGLKDSFPRTQTLEPMDVKNLDLAAPPPPPVSPAVPERVVTLVPIEEGGEPITFRIGAVAKLVGRTVKEGVRIGDTRISRRHASFRVQGEAILVSDEGSANGTFVNNQRVKEQAVNDGDTVRFGAAAFRVKLG